MDIFGLILQASLPVKLVLLLLAVMSIASWALIAFKWRELAGALEDSEAFLEVYHERSLEAAYGAARELDRSPLTMVFLASSAEIERSKARAGTTQLELGQLRGVMKKLRWMAERETHRLERGLPFLATTGSSAPFIGLFGTVIGIIQSFTAIAKTGSASLAVVAPGIAEALIATAIGLAAAIPATIFYNLFVGRTDELRASIDLFREELAEDLVDLVDAPSPAQAPPRLAGS